MSRIGKFSIPAEFIEDSPKNAIKLFTQMELIVIRCEHNYATRCFDYIGISPKFDKNRPGDQIPRYRCSLYAVNRIEDVDKIPIKEKRTWI